jgi:hypothetical protein
VTVFEVGTGRFGEVLGEADQQLGRGEELYPLLGHPLSREVLGVVGEQDVGIGGQGGCEDVTVRRPSRR